MTKKRSSEILGVKMEIFSGKIVIQKSWSAKFFSVPPNSVPGLRRCYYLYTVPTVILLICFALCKRVAVFYFILNAVYSTNCIQY